MTRNDRGTGIANTALAAMLALTLGCAPLAAYAVEESESAADSAAAGDAESSSTSSSASAASTAQGNSNAQAFDYTGTYTAVLKADGSSEDAEVSVEDQEIEATKANQIAALAQNGGILRIADSVLTKLGNGTDEDKCALYGVNSTVVAVGKASQAILSGTSLQALAFGANGLFATNGATVFAKDVSAGTNAGSARGLDATYGGTVVASDLAVKTRAARSAGIATDCGGIVSLVSSTLETAGAESPLVHSAGTVEIENVTGCAKAAQLVDLEGPNTVLISNSSLASNLAKATASGSIANGVIIYQSESDGTDAQAGSTALFQASDSTLKSTIAAGAMFYLTNTTADIVLSNTTLSFDSGKAKLLIAAGNNSNNWGTSGKNGATATLTAFGELLEGDIEVDSISSLELFLLEGSTWTGSSTITSNAAGTDLVDNITVNIDASSGWTVTENATISNLNIEKGGTLVDASGKAVTIVDEDGNTLVDGASSVEVIVSGEFSTTVKTTDAIRLHPSTIDRTAFDAEFGTSTAFGTNKAESDLTDEERAALLRETIVAFFENL